MLILIISATIFLAGIVFTYFGFKNWNDGLEIAGAFSLVLGGIVAAVCVVIAITSHIDVEYKYQKDYMEYEILQEQIDSGNYNSTTITSDIISYNQKVMSNKRYYNSPWIGLYYYEGCEKLPLLEMKDKK